MSLPDGIFRVQTIEFDELPANARDRDRLVRWRLEKGAAFDTANTLLRYQMLPRQDKGYSVLACVAKQEIIAQYEDLLAGLGLEPWTVVPSSFNALNLYAPYLAAMGIPGYAQVWIAEGSYTTIIRERGGPRFYRYKEIKAGIPQDVTGRLIRELDDTIHFYLHMDRQQQSEVGHLYLSGESALIAPLSESLKNETSLKIETLVPSFVLAAGTGRGSRPRGGYRRGRCLVLKRPALITINFAGTNFRLLTRLQQGLIVTVLLLGTMTGGLLWKVNSYRAQSAALTKQVREFTASVEKMRPAMQERQQLVKDLGDMSGLLEARRFSWTQFLTGIEAAFPNGVALTRLEFNTRELTAVLEGTAQSPESLSSLMIGLQRSRSFTSPLLKHQSMDKGNLSFNVAVTYQEHLAAGAAPGAGR